MNDELKKKIAEQALSGLGCDGAHHKQYILEEILLMVTGKETVKEAILELEDEEYLEVYGLPEPGVP